MIGRRTKAFVAFLRSPGVLCTTLVTTLFLQLFATWDLPPDVFGHMYFFVRVSFWLCVAIGLALSVHFAFDQLTDWLARPDEPRSGERATPPATLIRRQ